MKSGVLLARKLLLSFNLLIPSSRSRKQSTMTWVRPRDFH